MAIGRLTPRLDYGLWFDADRLIRVLEPPIDIMPYLGSGLHTLAGCIFWSTLNYTIDLWNSRSAPPATRNLDRIFNHSRHLTDRQYLLSLTQARVDYKQKGYMFRKLSDQFERSAMTDLHKLIRDDYENKGISAKYWKTPEEVAACVLDVMTPDEAARFQAVIEGKGTPADEELLRPLIAWFAENFICFGNGPRWSAVFVSVGLGSWIREVRDRVARAQEKSHSTVEPTS